MADEAPKVTTVARDKTAANTPEIQELIDAYSKFQSVPYIIVVGVWLDWAAVKSQWNVLARFCWAVDPVSWAPLLAMLIFIANYEFFFFFFAFDGSMIKR